MGAIWTAEARFEAWKAVEVAALQAWEELGKVPSGTAAATEAAPTPTPEQVAERETVTNHDLAAFVEVLGEEAGEQAAAWIHYSLTSSDVVDTAEATRLRDAANLIVESATDLEKTVRAKALEHRDTAMIGRTHGMWAEATSFGLKLAGWVFEIDRNRERLKTAGDAVSVGKISGAVGTYAHLPSEIEASVCARLGIGVEPASTQVTARDRHAQYLSALALTGAGIERMATEIRHLQRSELSEVRETFGEGQIGSSAMPHKRNPILSERMSGMARLLRGYAGVGLENVALWHERDISHSSAERVVLPDASIVAHYMLVQFNSLMATLEVDTDRMRANLDATRGLLSSRAVLLAMIDAGSPRSQAYRVVQRCGMKAWESGADLAAELEADPDCNLDKAAIAECLTPVSPGESAAQVFARLESLF